MANRCRYARSGDVTIAYSASGEGDVAVLLLTGILSNVETLWEEPGLARAFERFMQFGRLLLMDRRGVGMSDRLELPPTREEQVADIDAVLDAAGVEQVAVLGAAGGTPQAVAYAAMRPERTRALILYGGFSRTVRAPDMPWADTPEEREARVEMLLENWGEGSNTALLAPSMADDPTVRDWFARLERTSASPGRMRALMHEMGETDVRDLLPQIHVPALVMHRTGDRLIDVEHSRYMAARIPGAKLVEFPGDDHLMSVGDTEAIAGEIEEFLTDGRRRPADRQLLTVLFTDIVGGTARAAELGDGRWRDVLAGHDAEVRRQLARFGGREVKTIGDGFLAVFEGPPSPAVRCARAILSATEDLGVHVRAGLHTGECELVEDDVAGMAVHIAARVCAEAGAGEALASGTTYGTVVGSGLSFEDRGSHELRGVPGRWPIFRVR